MKRNACVVLLSCSLASAALADSPWKGTWVERKPVEAGRQTMTVEEAGSGWKLTYKISGPKVPGGTVVYTVVTQLDGNDAPVMVGDKPSGQTMAIKRVDSHHTFTVLKYQGKETGISQSELSSDGKVLKVKMVLRAQNQARSKSITGTSSKRPVSFLVLEDRYGRRAKSRSQVRSANIL